MFEKEFLPTENKINELRQAGVLPCSQLTNLMIATIFLIIALSIQAKSLNIFIRNLFLEQDLKLKNLILIQEFLIVPLIAFVVGYLLSQLLQSRFFFKLDLISLDFTRLNHWCFPNILKIFINFLIKVLLTSLIFCLLGFLVYSLSDKILALSKQEPLVIFSSIKIILIKTVPLICFLMFIFAVISWLFSRYMFIIRHRMTKSEKEVTEQGGL